MTSGGEQGALFDIPGISKSFGGVLKGIFGSGSIAQQFLVWGVMQQLAGAILAPVVGEIQQGVFALAPDLVNTPATLANMVARGLLGDDSGKNNAAKNGIGGEAFEELVSAAGSAPPVTALVALLQRKLIGLGGADGKEISFNGGLTDGGLREGWLPLMEKLSIQIPSGADVMNAWLEGQIEEAEANTRWIAAGMDPTWFQTAYNANGQAPTPVQALELWNRGIISESGTGPASTSYEQAFLEGPWRNKWLAAFKALRFYLPPPRTVTAMVREGSIDHDLGLSLLLKQGLTADLAAAYLTGASHEKTVAEKNLSKSDTLALYKDSLINEGQAVQLLEAVGYTATEAGYLLKLADVQKSTTNLRNAVSRVQSQFIGGRLTEAQAEDALKSLGVPADQVSASIAAWVILHQGSTPRLTASELASASFYQVITDDEAITRIVNLGYTQRDATIMVYTREHGLPQGATLPAE